MNFFLGSIHRLNLVDSEYQYKNFIRTILIGLPNWMAVAIRNSNFSFRLFIQLCVTLSDWTTMFLCCQPNYSAFIRLHLKASSFRILMHPIRSVRNTDADIAENKVLNL